MLDIYFSDKYQMVSVVLQALHDDKFLAKTFQSGICCIFSITSFKNIAAEDVLPNSFHDIPHQPLKLTNLAQRHCNCYSLVYVFGISIYYGVFF